MTGRKLTSTLLLCLFFLINHLLKVHGVSNTWNIQLPQREIAALREKIRSCSDVAQMYDIEASDGTKTTPLGNKLTVVVLGTKKERHSFGVPEVRIVGNLHGNEFAGLEIVKTAVNFFCEAWIAYKTRPTKKLDKMTAEMNSNLVRFLKTTRIHLLPFANPDGSQTFIDAYHRRQPEKYRGVTYGRNNSNGFDLNRNFLMDLKRMAQEQGVPANKIRPPTNTFPLQPETKMLMFWMKSQPFIIGLNYHAGEFLVSYPFDAERADGKPGFSLTADPLLVVKLARKYRDNYLVKRGACRRTTKTINGIINGADWYPFDGSMPDYSYLNTQCIELTVESSCEKFPSRYLRFLRNAQLHLVTLSKFLDAAHWGIKGRVSEFAYGISATIKVIFLSESPYLSKRLTKSALDGEYYRLLYRGRYAVVATASGFGTKVVCTDIVNDNKTSAKIINFNLSRDAAGYQPPIINYCTGEETATIRRLLL